MTLHDFASNFADIAITIVYPLIGLAALGWVINEWNERRLHKYVEEVCETNSILRRDVYDDARLRNKRVEDMEYSLDLAMHDLGLCQKLTEINGWVCTVHPQPVPTETATETPAATTPVTNTAADEEDRVPEPLGAPGA